MIWLRTELFALIREYGRIHTEYWSHIYWPLAYHTVTLKRLFLLHRSFIKIASQFSCEFTTAHSMSKKPVNEPISYLLVLIIGNNYFSMSTMRRKIRRAVVNYCLYFFNRLCFVNIYKVNCKVHSSRLIYKEDGFLYAHS